MDAPLRVFESFAGIGTQHMALKRLGIPFEVVAISEFDKDASLSYTAIHGKVHNFGDITKIDYDDIPPHDLFTYSFPCQSVSKEGNLEGFEKDSGTKSSVIWSAIEIIRHMKPKYLLAENVKNIISKRFIGGFNELVKTLDNIGYNTYYKVINSERYVPQKRERVFVVSIRKDIDNGSFEFKEFKTSSRILLDLLDTDYDPKYIVTDTIMGKLLWQDDGKAFDGNSLKVRNATKRGYLNAEHGDSVELTQPSSKTRRGRVQKQATPTLSTHSSVSVLLVEDDAYTMRRLKPIEYWRLMDIADEDYFKAEKVVKETALYRLAGNAIVVGVLEDIFRSLLTSASINDIT